VRSTSNALALRKKIFVATAHIRPVRPRRVVINTPCDGGFISMLRAPTANIWIGLNRS